MAHIKLLRKKEDKYIEHYLYHRIWLEGLTETSLEERIKKNIKIFHLIIKLFRSLLFKQLPSKIFDMWNCNESNSIIFHD